LEECKLQFAKTAHIEIFNIAQHDFSGKFEIPQKLYGRENEVNTLLQAFERVSNANTEMMLVAGYSGVGKTALVHEVHKPMTEKRGYFAAGKFDQFQKNIPYSAITQAFNNFCRYLLMANAETLANWRSKILAAVGNNGQIIIDVVPDLELVIGKQPAVAEVGPTEALNRFQLFSLNFIKTLCRKEHPFILFIDDLQWVDSASLGLLKSILLDDEIQYMLIIGAYRDNEVDGSHPFIMALDELQKTNVVINTIELANLQPADINHLLQDSLLCEAVRTQSLTDLIEQKTQGNAFFTHQFLHTLYEEELLHFDFEQHQWQWDVKQIAAQNITDNVVELMANKIDKWPEKTSMVLQLAACIGNQFDLSILAIICEQNQNETLERLRPAIIEGLIQPLDEKSQFKFLHDRVQQAAYAQIDDEQKKTVHLQIGRLLLANVSTDKLAEKHFEIVDHLNVGRELITNAQEQVELAQLNLEAGQKAKDAIAYRASIQYLQTGMMLLSTDSWQTDYNLTLNLYVEGTEAAYLSDDIEKMTHFANLVLDKAGEIIDKVPVFETMLQAYSVQNQYLDGIHAGLTYLRCLGVELPEEPSQEQIGNWLTQTRKLLDDYTQEHLLAFSVMTDPLKLSAMKILTRMIPLCYFGRPTLFPLISCAGIKLSIKYGNAPDTPVSYVNYGLVLCDPNIADYTLGYQCGQLAHRLLQQQGHKQIAPIVLNNHSSHIAIWKEHLRDTLPSLKEGYQIGLEVGDLEFSSYGIMNYLRLVYAAGEKLSYVREEFERYSTAFRHVGYFGSMTFSMYQTVLNLMGEGDEPCELKGEVYNEKEELPSMLERKNNFESFVYYFNKISLNYLFERFEEAQRYIQVAETYAYLITGHHPLMQFCFFAPLVELALTQTFSEEVFQKVEAWQKYLKKWAEHAPMNYQHKYDLVEAEKARVLGQILEAETLYEQAIKGAADNEYIQEEALAYELAAKFYLGRGMEKFAKFYLRDAHYAYQQWGATAKVRQLEAKYPQLLTAQKNLSTNVTITGTVMSSISTRLQTSTVLDLDSVIKAAQTLTGEIVLSKLLEKMMYIVIENAGAERGFLLLPQGEQWIIEAEGAVDKKEVTILRSLPVEKYLPEAIISYVARTQENVLLDDATQEGLYTDNSYIKTHQTQSVLCFPIVYQQQLRAILYFENNLTTGAFTPQRIKVLTMLSSQIAISLENAQVMANLDTKVKERTVQLNAKVEELTQTRHELVQSEKMASLGRLVAGFAHELNTPLGVAIGSASLLQRKAKQINVLMEQEEVDVDELLAALQSIDKGSDLTLSNLERAAKLVTSFKRTAVDQTSDEVRSFHVHQVVNDIINTLNSRFKKTDIAIQVNCPDDIKIKSLPGALEQILTNLLMNSFTHGFNEGKNAGIIQLKVQLLDGEQLHLEYSDNGKGIASENLEKIFEPFFTTHRAHGGSGLGMYICYNIVTTQLHGTLTCESIVGEGVVFKVDYPIDTQ
jgi:predicted ATPase/signal transduction histidine kinase